MSVAAEQVRAERPAAEEHAPYYGRYIAQVADGDVVAILEKQTEDFAGVMRWVPEAKAGHRYAEGKWSVREVVGHLSDSERIFTYRALRIARNDQTPLPGFDEKSFVANGTFEQRTLTNVLDEFLAVRRASIALFGSFTADEWLRRGTASDKPISVRALAWIVAGHERHHLKMLRESYGV